MRPVEETCFHVQVNTPHHSLHLTFLMTSRLFGQSSQVGTVRPLNGL
jgi:hypothetical protein